MLIFIDHTRAFPLPNSKYKYIVEDLDFYLIGYTDSTKLNEDKCIVTNRKIGCGTFTIKLNPRYIKEENNEIK